MIYNASGPRCTTFDELDILNSYESKNHIILTKSATLEPRYGNEFPRYYDTPHFSINSTGLANIGYQKYIEYAKTRNLTKPFHISVAGLCQEDNLRMIRDISNEKKISGIELNMSCPNIEGKSQIGYDFEASNELLRKIGDMDIRIPEFGIKLPPYFDHSHFTTMADIIREYQYINYVTCINSLGNGFVFTENFKSAIKPNGGYGGIGGEIIKPFALANVRKFAELIGNRVDIVGCGGISTGRDVMEHINCGAKRVQIGTQFQKEGYKCFERIEKELEIKKND